MTVTIQQKTNEAFYHELTYYEPDGTTTKDITNIDIYVEIRGDNGGLIKRFSNIANVASDLVKTDAVNGVYSISETMVNVKQWKVGLAKSDIIYNEDREDSTVTFNVDIIRGVTRV